MADNMILYPLNRLVHNVGRCTILSETKGRLAINIENGYFVVVSSRVVFRKQIKSRDLTIPFLNDEQAEIAMKSLVVDPEPRRNQVAKSLTVEDNVLHVSFQAQEARNLRVASNSFLDHLTLVMKTIDMFASQS